MDPSSTPRRPHPGRAVHTAPGDFAAATGGARRSATWVALAAILILIGLAPAGAPDSVRAAPSASSTTEAAQGAYDAAVFDLLVLERRLASAQDRLEQAQAKAAAIENDLTAARTAEEQASADLTRLEERRAERLRNIYMSRGTGWLEVLTQSGDLTEFLNRVFLLERIVSQESDLAHQVADAQAEAAAAAAGLEDAQAEQRVTVAELSARETELRDARTQQKALAARLGSRLAEAKAAAKAARRRMNELNAGAGGANAGREGGDGPSPSPSPDGTSGGSGGAGDDGGGTSDGSAGQRPPGRQLRVKATAYALPGTTATGVGVRYGIVAVDPRVIPLGTRLWIPGYGEGLAADTGGDIKGNWIDVWLPSEREALDWGVKYVTITILD